MRTWFLAAAAIAALFLSPDAVLPALASAAAVLFEAAPFVLAGAALERLPRLGAWAAYAGCGCGTGPSARSIPAALAVCFVFGPAPALARVVAAAFAARVLPHRPCGHSDSVSPLGALHALLGSAALCGAASQVLPLLDFTRVDNVTAFGAGALFGFALAPCGIGGVAVAAAMRAHSHVAAAAFLSVAGIVDARAIARTAHARDADHDAMAYALLSAACATVAMRHGDALVRPQLALLLGICALATGALFVTRRRARAPRTRIAPVLMLAGALVTAPPPLYRGGETTMHGLFPGEPLSFTGRLARAASGDALVRYAISCCRADAAPVVVRLTARALGPDGAWLHAEGKIVEESGRFFLAVRRSEAIPPPSDPFVYR